MVSFVQLPHKPEEYSMWIQFTDPMVAHSPEVALTRVSLFVSMTTQEIKDPSQHSSPHCVFEHCYHRLTQNVHLKFPFFPQTENGRISESLKTSQSSSCPTP